MIDVDALLEADARHVWHPATHFDDLHTTPTLLVRRAQGATLELHDGRTIVDGISSWWTSMHGHCHPDIMAALRAQTRQLDHVMFAGFTHPGAIELAQRLVRLCGPSYSRVFYADCGSAAIEVALKLSVQWHAHRGQPQRTQFASLHAGYHGETLGALSLCGEPRYRDSFAALLSPSLLLSPPAYPTHDDADLATDLGADHPATHAALAQLDAHAHELAAVVLEPLVQCAGKMTCNGVGFYRRVVEHAQSLGVHVIADEIATGLYRTGAPLASHHADVAPDFVCLSKALTGGVLPMSAVVMGAQIDAEFRGDRDRAFAHSHTFTAHPMGCAAANASLALFERPDIQEAIRQTTARLNAARAQLADAPLVLRSRQAGLIVAFDLDASAANAPDGRLALHLREAALRHGALVRPLHDTLYWMPPWSITAAELQTLVAATQAALRELSAG